MLRGRNSFCRSYQGEVLRVTRVRCRAVTFPSSAPGGRSLNHEYSMAAVQVLEKILHFSHSSKVLPGYSPLVTTSSALCSCSIISAIQSHLLRVCVQPSPSVT